MAQTNSVKSSQLFSVAAKLGLNPVSRKGYVKYYAAGQTRGACIQIWLSKDNASSTQIDLVNVTSPEAIPHKHIAREGWYKSVQQQLDTTKDAKAIVRAFYLVGKQIAEAAKQAAKPVVVPGASPVASPPVVEEEHVAAS